MKVTSINNNIKTNFVEDTFYKATLTLNYTCNNKCYWCYARNAIDSKSYISKRDMEKCIQTINDLKIKRCQIIGGEPLIYPFFFETLDLLSSLSIEVFIASNGRMLANHDFFQKILQYNITSFDLSIQGLDNDDYIKNTGVDGFNDYLQAVNNLKQHSIHSVNTYVITELNEKRISDLLEFCKTNNIDNIIIEFEKGVVGEKNSHLQVADCAAFTETVYDIFNGSGIKYTIAASFPLCLIPEKVLTKLISSRCLSTACHVQGKNVLTIDPDCHLLPCSAFVDYPFEDDRAILKGAEDVCNFLSSSKCNDFYDRARTYPNYNCVGCRYWDICGGGCFVRWFFEKPQDCIKSKSDKKNKLSEVLSKHNTGTATYGPESSRNPYIGIDSKY